MTKRHWEQDEDGIQTLFADDQPVARLEKVKRNKANATQAWIRDVPYTITARGFWRKAYEVKDLKGQVVVKVEQPKWYKSSYVLVHQYKKYSLLLRNNPLAEWAILDHQQLVLSYGLAAENGIVERQIKAGSMVIPLEFDILLQYLSAKLAAIQEDEEIISIITTIT